MKITKEQKQRILELDPNFFNEKLEEGRWYKSAAGSIFNYRKGNNVYGFLLGVWNYENWEWHSTNVKLATNQEVLEALTKDAVKRGYLENIKNIDCLCDFNKAESQEHYQTPPRFYYEESCNKLWICDASYLDICVFYNGQWAQLLKPKQMTIQEIEKELGYNIEIV